MAGRRTPAGGVALGGVLAALAVVIMAMGTLIPVATYVCPMLCALLLHVVGRACGSRMAWAWYGAVTILSLLLAPDKEAAAIFGFLGYYPIIKSRLDGRNLAWLWKALLFNGMTLLAYGTMMYVLGLEQLKAEFAELGAAMEAVLLLLGNVTFFLLDRLLGMRPGKKRHTGGT